MPEDKKWLKDLVVEVSSPDNQIKLKLESLDRFALGFRPGSYGQYNERDLETQLARLAESAWEGARNGYLMATRGVSEELAKKTGEVEEADARRRRYLERRKRLVLKGKSAGGWISARTLAMGRWKFFLADDAVSKLSEPEFVAEFKSVSKNVISDYRGKVTMLRDEYFGLLMPAKLREYADKHRPSL